jgi:hypothetical protein
MGPANTSNGFRTVSEDQTITRAVGDQWKNDAGVSNFPFTCRASLHARVSAPYIHGAAKELDR